MNSKPVNWADLSGLVGFLNLSSEDLDAWNSDHIEQDGSEKMFALMRLTYMVGLQDTKETLTELKEDLAANILGLLNPDKSAEAALAQLFERIHQLKLTTFRKIVKPIGQKKDKYLGPVTKIELVRVSPPKKNEKGRRTPTVESLAFAEYDIDESARQNYYRIVDAAITNNTIAHIRNCLNCHKFFLRDGRRLTYCSPRCETEFNNTRRTEYFANRHANLPKRKKRSKSPQTGRLRRFIQAAYSAKRSLELDGISRALRRIGDGQGNRAWGEIARWETALKNGASETAVLKTIKPHIREAIWETLR